jgi:hypothetical protein
MKHDDCEDTDCQLKKIIEVDMLKYGAFFGSCKLSAETYKKLAQEYISDEKVERLLMELDWPL